jgi:uncharacterized protein YkwD
MKQIALLFYFVYLIGHPNAGGPYDPMIAQINQIRESTGEDGVYYNKALAESAQKKCQDMIDQNYFSHYSPDGTAPWKFYADAGYTYHFAGENLVRSFSNEGEAMTWLMESPTHKQIILDPKFDQVGIGRCSGKLSGVLTSIVVQHFGKQQ